ncbi:hypothetical protein [Cryptosporangium aurantiacum]|uniref:Uncharacterized protein n=1 Tax=Cryptosporangium aurantiacum TaxID=134849 RepID=A0A1M7RLF6_9ACTN|nr:hypothetical protein [Cryptosporangium aurantiacum]SHN46918.1 hypothetical protein SAMN05443668_11913 [Cryptosporangium aurantiacum]
MAVTDWIQAGADAFAALGTVGAFGVGFVLFRREHRREESHAEEDRRAQAAKVSAWVAIQHARDGKPELMFHVHNASEMPIYETALPLPARPDEAAESEFVGLVPPGQTIKRPAPEEWLKSYYSPEPVQIEFLDSAGWFWTRDEQGFLYRNPERMRPDAPSRPDA